MYVRIEDDNEVTGSIVVFETKQDVIDWLTEVYGSEGTDMINVFIKNNRLEGQGETECGTYEYIEEVKFWKK